MVSPGFDGSVLFLLTSFYGLIDWRLIVIQLACCLYNIGVNIILMMYLATWNYKSMDLSTGSMMYYKSSGIVQRVFTFLLIILPLIDLFWFLFFDGQMGWYIVTWYFGTCQFAYA